MKKHTKKVATLLTLVSAVFLFGGTVAQSGAKPAKVDNPLVTAYASCDNKKPFKPAKRCRYDGGTKFRGTFFFKSKIGPLDIKTCFKIYGPKPLGGRHDCGNIYSVRQRALPFKTYGSRQRYTVKFTLWIKGAGSDAKMGKAAAVKVKVRP